MLDFPLRVDFDYDGSIQIPHDHSAFQASPMIAASYGALTACEPRGDIDSLLSKSSQNGAGLMDAGMGPRDGLPLRDTPILPPVNSILHGNTPAPPTQQPWANQHGYSVQSSPWNFHHTPMSWAWTSQPPSARNASPYAEAANSRFSLQDNPSLLGNLIPHAEVDPYSCCGDGFWRKAGTKHRQAGQSQAVRGTTFGNGGPDCLRTRVVRGRPVSPLTCQSCGSVFSRPDCLVRHKRTVCGSRLPRWPCQLCGGLKRFTRYDSLLRHMRSAHLVSDFPGKKR